MSGLSHVEQTGSDSLFPGRVIPPSENHGTEAPEEGVRKRRATTSRISYPRKRAITACQLCRLRKTKCDNQRPSCGSCLALDIHCEYQDRGITDLSSFDPATLAILDRLNIAVQLLQQQAHLPTLVESLIASQALLRGTTTHDSSLQAYTPTNQTASLSSAVLDSPDFTPDTNSTLEDVLQGPCNCHNVLVWPVFGDKIVSSDLLDAFYDPSDDQKIREGGNSGRKGIREDDTPALVEHFLQHVHIKNPILDSAHLISMARTVAEDGFKWDGVSCLVLVASALANLAVPFSISVPAHGESSVDDAKDYAAAEAYYGAARKRTGLLDNSILSVQCMFLLGVYQMYSMRPLKAWMSFSQACAMFQVYLRTESYRQATRTARRLEQRLYWSCLKSECEMREQIDLPPSGLAKVNYPDVFPSPPGGTPEPETRGAADQSVSPRLQVDHEKSWYYYLSEIAFRQLRNRITTVLYSGSPFSWQPSSLPKLYRLAEELDSEVQKWAEHIPGFANSMREPTTDELTHVLIARYLDLQELICRPFLYLVLHSEYSQQSSLTTLAYAERGLDLQTKIIRQISIKHRHHGAWYAARQCFTASLMLLATVQSGRVPVPDDWEATLQLGLNCLSYYQAEAPDLGVAHRVLVNFRSSLTSVPTIFEATSDYVSRPSSDHR